MLGTDLSYVKEQLARCTLSEWKELASSLGLNLKTIRRIARKEMYYPRADTLGKIALHFRVREKRRKV